MYILLEEGMIINFGDECHDIGSGEWEDLGPNFCGYNEPYRKDHVPMRRKINTVEELFTAYNKCSPK
jgi:hypothetical protein